MSESVVVGSRTRVAKSNAEILGRIAFLPLLPPSDFTLAELEALEPILRLLTKLDSATRLLGIVWYSGWYVAIIYTGGALCFFNYVDGDMRWHSWEAA